MSTIENNSGVSDTFAAATITCALDPDAGSDFIFGGLTGDFASTPASWSAAYDGNAMTALAAAVNGDDIAKIFGYVNPDIDASYDTVFDGSVDSSPGMAGIAIAFSGVDQTTPFGTVVNVTAGSGNISQALTTVSGDYAIGVIFSTDFNNVSGGDLLLNSNSALPIAILGEAATGTTTTLTANLTGDWVGTFVVIKAASGGGGGGVLPLLQAIGEA